jgi:TonB family protein
MRTSIPLFLLILATLVPGAAGRVMAQGLAGSPDVGSQGAGSLGAGSLEEARAFYASAEYDRALALLERLADDPGIGDARPAAELYRALCLLALGRDDEATVAVDTLVAEHPSYRPTQELPPRVQALFDATRERLLPMAIQARYLAARAAYDQRDYGNALQGFTETLELFSQPEVARMASGPPLSDLWMLADGFLELSATALSPSPVAVVQGPPGEPVGPTEPVPPPVRPVLYSVADRDVVPPRVIDQSIPAFPGPVRTTREGVIQVVIDDRGEVAESVMLESLGDRFDELALAASKRWQYRPATLSGTPVPFVKRVRVSLVPSR